MAKNNLLSTIREKDYEKLEDFIRENLHYLSKQKQKIFYAMQGITEKTRKNSDSV